MEGEVFVLYDNDEPCGVFSSARKAARHAQIKIGKSFGYYEVGRFALDEPGEHDGERVAIIYREAEGEGGQGAEISVEYLPLLEGGSE